MLLWVCARKQELLFLGLPLLARNPFICPLPVLTQLTGGILSKAVYWEHHPSISALRLQRQVAEEKHLLLTNLARSPERGWEVMTKVEP